MKKIKPKILNKLLLILVGLCIPLLLHAQKGYIYLHNYDKNLPETGYQNFDVLQGEKGVMYFANRKGILTYNGVEWNRITTPGTPYSFERDTTGRGIIYVGCNNDFGSLIRNNKREKSYISFSRDHDTFGDITDIGITKQYVYFYSSSQIFQYAPQKKEIKQVYSAPQNKKFTGFFIHHNRAYVNIENQEIQLLDKGKFTPTNSNKFKNNELITYSPFNKNKTLIGTKKGNIYLFDGKQFTPYAYDLKDYIKENALASSLRLSKNRLVFSTLSGGCVIINKKTGTKEQIINYQTGLTDDEILSMTSDTRGGLWICTEYGISRADIKLPVNNFSYSGLEGTPMSVLKNRDTLYVATSEGVYYLGKVTKMKEVEQFIKKEHKRTTQTRTYEKMKTISKLIKVTFSPPDSVNKNTSPITQKIPLQIEVPVDSVATSVKDVFTNKKVRKTYALQTITHIFKSVKNIDEKCRQIINYKDKILVASNKGLWEISNHQASLIIPDIYVNYLYTSDIHPDRVYIGSNKGISVIKEVNNEWKVIAQLNSINEPIHSIAENQKNIWLGAENKVYKTRLNPELHFEDVKAYPIKTNFTEIISVFEAKPGILFSSSNHVYAYNKKADSLYQNSKYRKYKGQNANLLNNHKGYTWIEKNNQWRNIHPSHAVDSLKAVYLRLFDEIDDIYVDQRKNLWVIDENKIFKVDGQAQINPDYHFPLIITSITDKQDHAVSMNHPKLEYANNALTFNCASLFYLSENVTQYRFRLKGLNKEWSEWSNQSTIEYPFLPSGNYTLLVQAKNIFGQKSDFVSYDFTIIKPFWQKWWFFLIAGLALAFLVYIVIRIRTKRLERANRILDAKVKEATQEIRKQKDEIEQKNKNITASINYAERIQEAFLPFEEEIHKVFPDSFVLLKPRDIVSGDFYWFHENEQNAIISAADCTGHGIPGAFMSMIGNTLMNQIIREKNITDPGKILKLLDQEIVKALRQDQGEKTSDDGMDITICTYNKQQKTLEFAGANNPLYFIRNGEEVERIKGDPYGIGGVHPKLKEKKFTTNTLEITNDTYCYIFSDGYVDQMGGEKGKKFKSGPFKNLLLDIHTKSFEEQKNILDDTIEKWRERGQKQQIDDILVIGFKL